MNKSILSFSILVIIFISACTEIKITNFDECIAAGNPAMESYPRQCRANDQTFVEEINDIIPTIDSEDVGPLGSYFSDQIISIGVEKIGQPIEGFDAYLLKKAFPGLIDEDFHNVEALLGRYKFVNDELIFDEKRDGPIHSAQKTVSKKGMGTLMENAAGRLKVEITLKQGIDKLIDLIGIPENNEEKLKICPDSWIDNRMPIVCEKPPCQRDIPSQYFVLDSKRIELSVFDVEWVKDNCDIEPSVVV